MDDDVVAFSPSRLFVGFEASLRALVGGIDDIHLDVCARLDPCLEEIFLFLIIVAAASQKQERAQGLWGGVDATAARRDQRARCHPEKRTSKQWFDGHGGGSTTRLSKAISH